MRTPLVAGNWKMHKTLAEARELVQGIRSGVENLSGCEVLICPPYTLLFPMAKAVAGSAILLGAQNVHEQPQGAFTGEVSVAMLKDTGCTHVIVGHSERRQHFGERGPQLARKVRAALAAGLRVIYCVGESLAERESGKTRAVIETQLHEVLDAECARSELLIVAYEPVWAIGTGKTATPQQAQEVHGLIRAWLASNLGAGAASSTRILYGGSVKPDNAAALAGQADIDGMLVGGASLAAGDFTAIVRAVADARSAARR
jgi:triosephosphate isomerase